MNILVLIRMVFTIIWEISHGKMSLNPVLLLLVNFVSCFRLELMYISHCKYQVNITQLHGFQLLVLEFVEITFLVCTKRINLSLKESSKSLVIVAKGFLKLPNLHMLLKQKSLSLPRNLALGTFGKSLLVFSTKVNLLYFLISTTQRCCLLHLLKRNCFLKTFLILMTQVSLYPFSILELIWNCLFL